MINLSEGHIARIIFWLWFFLIAVASLLPGRNHSDMNTIIISGSGFWEHALVYGIASIMGCRAFSSRNAGVLLIGIFGVGVGFEYIQRWLLNRTFNPMDILANGLGILTGIIVYMAWRRMGNRSFPNNA